MLSIAVNPILPWWMLAIAAALALLVVGLGFKRRMRGSILRGLALAALLAALTDPSIQSEDRKPLKSVVAVVADRSASQDIGDRTKDTDAATAALVERLKRFPNLDVRVIDASRAPTGDGTKLFTDIGHALENVPSERVAGIIAVTDGEVHDVPRSVAELGFKAPFHALITGYPDEVDRRVNITAAPKFALVKSTQSLSFKVEDQGKADAAGTAEVVIKRDGVEIDRQSVAIGVDAKVDVEILHGGSSIIEIETPPLDGELSPVNNKAVAVIEGIRENLRVLLVSGEPNAGERTWRNLLKSDASVDLVHFTILRPPEKQDGTPVNELSLIAFPTRELFDTKIDEFDLIIFDRYQRKGVLPLIYFDNIARYVSQGGAVLIAAGPDPDNSDSVYDTPLAPTLPALPTGGVTETPFKPEISDIGKRHPVTRDLPGSGSEPPAWSRWFRLIDADTNRGDTIMTGPDKKPLLVLSHEGDGRVAMLLSDQVWLWSRGFEGGGPHLQLLRRLAHWLMKEPDLEEEALRLTADRGSVVISRQTLRDKVDPVSVTLPNSDIRQIDLKSTEPGLFTAEIPDAPLGLYQAREGDLTALAHLGPTDPREYRSLISSEAILKDTAVSTGGTVQRLKTSQSAAIATPRIVTQYGGTSFGGDGWIGLNVTDAYEVTGLSQTHLLTGFLGLALFLLALGSTWWREGR